jgi:endonuclease-8
MAEGHSIVRWARRLQGLVNRPLREVQLPERYADDAERLRGERVTAVDTHGKHLMLRLSEGRTIHCHALMYGSWQFGAPGMELRKPAERVRLRLATDRFEAVFFNGPVVELLDHNELIRHRSLSKLGPDVLHEPFDREEAWRRLRGPGSDLAIGDAVLRQELVAGIGNIYKSEALFLSRIHPRRTVGTIDRSRIERLWNTVVPLMRDGARGSGRIVTTPSHLRRRGQRYWVYRRRREPCLWCGAPIQRIVQGPLDRSTYFCGRCQR